MAALTSCETLYCFRAISKGQNWPSRPVGSLRNQPSFCDATTRFPAKWRLRNSILLTRQLPDLGCASDWSCRGGNLLQPIRSATHICVVTVWTFISMDFLQSFLRRHFAGKPVVVSQNVGCFLRLWNSESFFTPSFLVEIWSVECSSKWSYYKRLFLIDCTSGN